MPEILLKLSGVEKSFPGVRAVIDGHFELRTGECHALMGENGAGKSTLIKIIAGAHQPDAGTICVSGRQVTIPNPLEAGRLGIAVIHQELQLVPGLSVAENIFLGREKTRLGLTQPRDEIDQARGIFAELGVPIDPTARCGSLTIAMQQLVEIAKALSRKARIVVMDEPTAALSDREVVQLHRIVENLTDAGVGVVYVSHRMDEIFRICHRITVMRDGTYVATSDTSSTTRAKIIEQMVGRSLASEFPPRTPNIGGEKLRVEHLTRGKIVCDVSFTLHGGEVLGLVGLVGAGRTETARLLFGADRADSGQIFLNGQLAKISSPIHAIRAGICLLTEDRKHQGLILPHSVRQNFALPNLASGLSRLGFVRNRAEKLGIKKYIADLRIKVPGPEQLARNLSGGNQQKVVLAKWLERNADILIFDEPTRGIDVGSKFEIYQLINSLAAAGKAILVISSELPEVLGICDRLLVMREGRIAGELPNTATQGQIMELATVPNTDPVEVAA